MIYYITSNGKDLKDGNTYDIKKDFEISKEERF